VKKIAKQTYDEWAKEFEESFWSKTMGWGMAFCNQFNVENDSLWAEDNRGLAEVLIFEQYVDEAATPDPVQDTEFDFTPYPTITEEAQQAILDYVNKGEDPGGFLNSVLCNDLVNAVGRAGDQEFAMIRDLVNFVYKNMPYETWGNHKAVAAYQRRFEVKTTEKENV